MAFDFSTVTSPFRMQPGLRRLANGAGQLTPLAWGDAALAEKLGVLTHHATRALLVEPGFDAAPSIAALFRHASVEHPGAFAWDGHAHWQAPQLGWSVDEARSVQGSGPSAIGDCLRALPKSWRAVGLLALAFAEDFALLDGASGRVRWLAVCLPSHWAPEEKIGRHFTQIHAPVADNQTLLTASDHLVRLVTGADHWERFVWTITPCSTLDRHPARTPAAAWSATADAAQLAAAAWFRTERQTFIPAPDRREAIFTIHVETRPLAAALPTASHALALHDALASMSLGVLAYRNLVDAQARLLEWLAERAGSTGPCGP